MDVHTNNNNKDKSRIYGKNERKLINFGVGTHQNEHETMTFRMERKEKKNEMNRDKKNVIIMQNVCFLFVSFFCLEPHRM